MTIAVGGLGQAGLLPVQHPFHWETLSRALRHFESIVVTCEPFMRQKELVEDSVHYSAAQEVAFITIWASLCASMDALEIAKKELKL